MSKFKLVRLIVVFIVIIVAAVWALKYSINKIQSSKNDDIITNMLVIQGKIKVMNGDVKVGNSDNQHIGTKLSDLKDDSIEKKINNAGVTEESFEDFYLLSKENLAAMQILDDLKNVDDGEYIVNYKDCEVIYIKGIKKDGSTKYKLSDILN